MKHVTIFLALLLISLCLYSQGSIELNTARSTGGTEVACQRITLSPGFSFTADTGKDLTLSVDATQCDPYAGTASSVSNNQNYIQTKTYTSHDGSRYLEAIQYFDGLGRPVQTVQRGITPQTADLVTYQQYDPFGRESNSWLPAVATGNNGAYMPLATFKSKAMSTYANDSAYSRPTYEASPLNRVLEQYGPGKEWYAGKKAVRTDYLTNTTTGDKKLICDYYLVHWEGTASYLRRSGVYGASQLYVTRMTDENGSSSYEFKDKLGQVVLTRQVDTSTGSEVLHDTYYVYNDDGNLYYVIPPIAADQLKTDNTNYNEKTSQPAANYVYMYKYDDRNRCIKKKLPGCDWIYYVYDRADRLIFTQDGEQRKTGEWFFTIPDALGRIVLTGKCKTANNQTIKTGAYDQLIIKAEFSPETTYMGYILKAGTTTFNTLPLGEATVHSANYYDNYDFLQQDVWIYDYLGYTERDGYGKRYGTDAEAYTSKGRLTGTVTMLEGGGLDKKYMYSANYYDYKGRLIQTKYRHHLDGMSSEYFAYNFTGQPLKHWLMTDVNGQARINEYYTYSYDHAGRLLTTTHQLNNGAAVILAQNTYDELGRLQTTTKNNKADLKTTYTYNIRSWTKSITSPLFSQTLYYNDKTTAHTYSDYQPQYNGNISGMEWTLKGEDKRSNRFQYDDLSRLTHSAYNGVIQGGDYNTAYTYDKHGNITLLVRRGKAAGATGSVIIDYMTMDYNGNQLLKASDTGVSIPGSADFKNNSNLAVEYTYNANGALTKDLNKGITTIEYNSLNLPQAIEIASNSVKGKTKYTYSASGQKLRVIHETDMDLQTATIMATAASTTGTTHTRTTDYVGNKIYEDGTLKKILIEGGYYDNTDKQYYFFLSDHLGNNRVVTDQWAGVIQKNHYYPFGLTYADNTLQEQSKQPYKYNGKELDQMHGLNQYDYSARYYEPAIGRFTTVDPLAEKYYSISPYVYCNNNPMRFIDPTGMWIVVSDGNNTYRYDNGQLYREQMNFQTRSMEYVAYTPDAGSFIEAILNGLNDLVANSTEVGQSLVDFFSNDQNNIGISTNTLADEKGNHIALGEQGYPTIYMKSDLSGSKIPTQAGMQQSSFWLDLGHEIAHAHDRAIRGDAATATRDGLVIFSGEILQRTEVYATFRENQIRREAGLPLRTHYYTNTTETRGMGPSLIHSSGQSTFLGTPYLPANTLPPPRKK